MKKSLFLVTCFISLSWMTSNAQNNGRADADRSNKQEAKKIAREINAAIDDLSNSIESVDWEKLGRLIERSIELADTQANTLLEIAERVDVDKLAKEVERAARRVEKSVELKSLEKQLEDLEIRIEKRLEDKKTQPRSNQQPSDSR